MLVASIRANRYNTCKYNQITYKFTYKYMQIHTKYKYVFVCTFNVHVCTFNTYSTYTYEYRYVCMYMHVYVCIACIRIYACIVCIVCIRIYMYVYWYLQVFMYLHVYVRTVCICMYICIVCNVCMCMNFSKTLIQIQANTCKYMRYIHIRKQIHEMHNVRIYITPCQENFPNAVGAVTKPLGDG